MPSEDDWWEIQPGLFIWDVKKDGQPAGLIPAPNEGEAIKAATQLLGGIITVAKRKRPPKEFLEALERAAAESEHKHEPECEHGCVHQTAAEEDEMIAEFGYKVMYIFVTPDNPLPFYYTVGLNDKNWPELILIGLPPHLAKPVIDATIEYYTQAKRSPLAGEVNNNILKSPLMFGPVSEENIFEYAAQAVYRAQRLNKAPIRALQIIWSDRQNRFPNDPEFNEEYRKSQPLLSNTLH